VVAGVFPILLLLASRRKGENIPAFVLPFLAHPMVAGGIYLMAVSTLFLHGLLIWQDPFQRGIALLVGSIILAITALLMRQGAFACRLVIEVRQDTTQEGTGIFTVTDSGRAATEARVQLDYADEERLYQAASGAIPEFAALCSAKFQIPSTKAKELAVWLHRVTVEGQSENLPALLRVSSGKDMREFHMDGASKQFVIPLGNGGKKEGGGRAGEFGQLEIEVQLAANPTLSPISPVVWSSRANALRLSIPTFNPRGCMSSLAWMVKRPGSPSTIICTGGAVSSRRHTM
jgi:hypothetical protein